MLLKPSDTYVSCVRINRQFGQRISTVSVTVIGGGKHDIGALEMKVAVTC